MTPKEADDKWMADAVEDLQTGIKLKQVMLGKGLRRAKAECPRCNEVTLNGAIVGRRNHFRAWCTTEGCEFSQMIE